MKRQNKNFLFNVAYQLIIYVFPLITSVFISRRLGAENLGIYAYVNSIVTICAMFCLLGISNHGNREIAKARNSKEELSSVFSSIYSLQIYLSSAVLLIYLICILLLPIENRLIFTIQILHILSVAFDITWLFGGLEKFKVILTRNLIVKLFSFLLIILLVSSKNDLWIYALIMSGSSFMSQLFLLTLAKKEVNFKLVGLKHLREHFKSCCVLFIPVVAYSIYRIMDKTMLGAMCEKSQLGYYENAERILSIPIMVITALGTVMLPHMAHLIEKGIEEFKKNIEFSMKLALGIGVFSCGGLIIVGQDMVTILYGSEFAVSGQLLSVLAVTVIASAWANVIRTQYLIPCKKDKVYVVSTLIGAGINLICNLCLIPVLQAVGACIGTILAEISIAVIQSFFAKELEIKKYLFILFKYLLQATATLTVVYFIGLLIGNIYARVCVQVAIAVAAYIVLNKSFVLNEFLGKRPAKAKETL